MWLADLPGQRVEVYRAPEPDGGDASVTRHRRGETLSPRALPDVQVPVDAVLGPA